MGNCLILMKNYDKPRTETYAVTSKGSSIDMGEYNNFRYIDASGVPNVNSSTYTPTSRSASLDMGVDNAYRYVNTNSVPNSNSTTFTPTSNNSAHDMGETNNYRYVNTNTVYNLGAADVIWSTSINQNWTKERSSDSGGKGTQTWSKSLSTGNYIAALAGGLNRPDLCYMNLSITGSNLANVTQLSRISQNFVDAWKTCGLTVYKFTVTATSTISFACSNSANTDYAICLSIIKLFTL